MRIYPTLLSRHSAVLWMLCGVVSPVLAGAGDGPEAPAPVNAVVQRSLPADANGALIDFDIPAQSLDTALQRYGTLSHQPALYRAEIVNGQMAAAVHGRFTPETALRLLLEGTGLSAGKFSTAGGSAFILQAADSTAMASHGDGLGDLSGYPGRVQMRVWQALCGNPQTVPGGYRSLLRFQVDAAGRVRQARLIGSSGDARRDAAMLTTLQDVQMDGAPPPDMPQPFTMLLLPREAGFGVRCGHDAPGNTGRSGNPGVAGG